MLRSMYSAISGMKANQTKLDVVANNIANVSTTAFKASKVNFSDALYQSMSNATAPTTTTGGTNAKTVGLGASVSSINKLMTTGNALTTGRSLDVCIDGDGYLIVGKGAVDATTTFDTTNTDNIGTTTMDSISYTRDGNLTLDEDGYLLTSSGLRVMGYYATGADITANATTGDATIDTIVDPDADDTIDESTGLHALAIPDEVAGNAVQSFSIGKDGIITVVTSAGKSVVGQIAMATFKNPEGLTEVGNNLMQESANSGTAIIRSAADLASDDTNNNSSAFGDMTQGYLEASNVDLTEQFTDMITATRAFQAASKMITNGDEILQTITGLIR